MLMYTSVPSSLPAIFDPEVSEASAFSFKATLSKLIVIHCTCALVLCYLDNMDNNFG